MLGSCLLFYIPLNASLRFEAVLDMVCLLTVELFLRTAY